MPRSEIIQDNLSEEFVFVQMNFWEGKLYYPIDVFLKREQPDILSAQEMLSGAADLSPGFMTAETLVNKGYFSSFISGLSKPIMTRESQDFVIQCSVFVNNAVTCVSENRIILYQDPNDFSRKEKDLANYCSLLHTQLRLRDGALVHVLNHHGRLLRGEIWRLGSEIADYNFKRIAEYISTLTGPVILSGDFNVYKEARSLQPLKDIGLINLNDVHQISEARNEFSWKANECVSHVFINEAVKVESYKVAQDNVSDHLPLILTCRVKR